MAARFRLVKYDKLPRFMDYRYPIWNPLVGGLEHFLFFHILRIIIRTDEHIFQKGLKPPTSPPFTSGFLRSHVFRRADVPIASSWTLSFTSELEQKCGDRGPSLGFGMMKKHPLFISSHWPRGIPKGCYFCFFFSQWCYKGCVLSYKIVSYIFNYLWYVIPVVPHKAVGEVSKIENL